LTAAQLRTKVAAIAVGGNKSENIHNELPFFTDFFAFGDHTIADTFICLGINPSLKKVSSTRCCSSCLLCQANRSFFNVNRFGYQLEFKKTVRYFLLFNEHIRCDWPNVMAVTFKAQLKYVRI
jgi:hypothetical protein